MTTFSERIRFGVSPTCAKAISGIESFVSHMAVVSADNRALMNVSVLHDLPPDECVHAYLRFIYGVYSAKLLELGNSLIASANEERFLVFSYCGRGLIETTATLRYYNQKIRSIISAASDRDEFRSEDYQKIISLVDTHIRGGRFDWGRYLKSGRTQMVKHLHGEQRKAEKERGKDQLNPRQVNAKTAVEAWAKQEPGILLFYDYFCDPVHPNMGSNLLVMGTDQDGFVVAGDAEKSVGRSLVTEGIEFSAPVLREAAGCMAQLLLWKETWAKAEAQRRRNRGAKD